MADEPGAGLPDGDEPPIVRLLKGLDDQNTRLRDAIRHVRRLWWALALVVAGMIVLGGAYKVQLDRIHALAVNNRVLGERTKALAVTTTRSLCELRHDLERRVAESRKFRRAHPRGIPGIPNKALRQSERGQRRTIAALSDLKCGQVARILQRANP